VAFAFEREMFRRVCSELAKTLVGQQPPIREWKWGRGALKEGGLPVDEFYGWFSFVFDDDFLVDLDGRGGACGRGTRRGSQVRAVRLEKTVVVTVEEHRGWPK